MTATINPVDKAKLETAIKTAETYYDSIKDNPLFASVAETLKKAIDGAKAAVENKNATASEVEGQIAAVDTAVDTAKKEAEEVLWSILSGTTEIEVESPLRCAAHSELITVIRLKCFSMERTSFSENMRRAAYSVETRRKTANTQVSEYAGIV